MDAFEVEHEFPRIGRLIDLSIEATMLELFIRRRRARV